MSDATRELAMFPLGSVLFPGMPLPLRVFEPRYVAMLSSVVGETEREFGVVLIERDQQDDGDLLSDRSAGQVQVRRPEGRVAFDQPPTILSDPRGPWRTSR